VKNSFSRACKRAHIKDFRIHDLRHTCATWLVTAGVPLSEVRDLLGHSSVVVTERYAHLAPENVRAAVEKLSNRSRSGHADEQHEQNKDGGSVLSVCI
jgi:integrase